MFELWNNRFLVCITYTGIISLQQYLSSLRQKIIQYEMLKSLFTQKVNCKDTRDIHSLRYHNLKQFDTRQPADFLYFRQSMNLSFIDHKFITQRQPDNSRHVYIYGVCIVIPI